MTAVYTRPPANQPTRLCAGCQVVLPPMTHQGNPRKWCSESCRLWAYYHPGQRRDPGWTPPQRPDPRPCGYCGEIFDSKHQAAKYCSLSCAGRANGPTRAAHYAVLRAARHPGEHPAECSTPGCDRRPLKRGRICGRCLRATEDPERVKARQRRKTHLRKMRTKRADLPLSEEIRLRATVKRCPLCRVRLIDEPYRPASKELDHIVPLNQGGAHSIWNVRIICRNCNIHRPKDGSDVTQVPLFAVEVA